MQGRNAHPGPRSKAARPIVAGLLLALQILLNVPALAQAPVAAPPAQPPVAQTQAAPPAAAPAAPSPAAPANAAPAGATMPAAGIGVVTELQGHATRLHNGKTMPVKLQDEIDMGDALSTEADGSLAVVFDDESTFRLSASASITIDEFVYQSAGRKNVATIKFVQGTIAFAAQAVARTGTMTLATPSATLGIRGTTGVVEVAPAGSASGSDAVRLYADANGKVGRIDVTGSNGVRLGILSRPATGLTLSRAAGGRLMATAFTVPPQQLQRDQGFVRQLHAAQVAGRGFIAQRRATRPGLAPGLQPNRLQPGRPGALQPNRLQQPGLRSGGPAGGALPNRAVNPAQRDLAPANRLPLRPAQQGAAPVTAPKPGVGTGLRAAQPARPPVLRPRAGAAVRPAAKPAGRPNEKKP